MPDPAPKAIFLSYARDDAAAARRIAEALRGAGLEVWFDENELTGGDAWDLKIRTQISDCALFLPVISANTQARLEGYFRLEWRLAEQRSHLMAKGKRFLVPVCIDDTREKGAQVPDAFMEVQWTRVVGGAATGQFVELVKRLLEGPRASAMEPGRPRPGERGSDFAKATTDREGAASPVLHPEVGRRVPAAAWIGAVAVVAIGIAAIFSVARKSESPTNAGAGTRPPTSEKSGAPKAAEKSVAVLAFENQSGDKENEYFSDGISDELLTQLGKVPGLRVAGRNSSFAFKGKPGAEAEVAQKLNVAYVVNGTVQKSGAQVKITARLINAADGLQVWSDKFTEEMKDIFAVQEKIAGLIAQSLSLKLGGAPRAAKVVDPEAQRLVLEGRFHWNIRTNESFTRAEAAFTKAIALAPDFAEAHSGLAGVYVIRVSYAQLDGLGDGQADVKRARSEAERAVQLDPSLAEAHAVLAYGLLLEGRLAESERSFQRALEHNPNSAVVHLWRGNLLACMGRIDLAAASSRRAAELDPLWFINLVVLAARLNDGHRWSESVEVTDRALSLRPDFFVPAHGHLIKALFELGRTDEATETARMVLRHPEVFPRWQSDSLAVFVLRRAGKEQEAADFAAQVLARTDLPPDSITRGFILAGLGRFEQARPFLEQLPSQATINLMFDAMWDPWRESASFRELIAKLGISEEYKTARATQARMQQEQAGKK